MPIAVVGMSMRGPADATSVEGLWKLVSEAREGRSKIPEERWNNDAFYHPDFNRNGTHNVDAGHFMTEDLSRFDAPFFNMTNAEAAALDPQQRLLLECTYEALENAGTSLLEVQGSKTSCFVGSFCGDYTDMLMRDPETVPMYQCTNSGHSRAILANRLSYFFNLQGPSATIDTACSASLVALHLGCQSLRTGDAKRAVVAGANVILSHEIMITMSMMRFMSPDGRCYTFDDRANGYARGEGVGCVILKPLEDALRDGDTIRAVIRGTGSNQDGKTSGITLPSGTAQELLIRSVYESAGLDPLETSYVEAHGTGTSAGDPLEAGALSRVFCPARSSDEPLRIGSIKTNIGHLEGASGIAGVIKTILMLENKILLPHRNFKNPNPRIPFHDWKLKVNTALEPWISRGPRRASVNSFGYGGSNSHAILESAEDYLSSHGLNGSFRKAKSILDSESGDITSDYSIRSASGNTNSNLESHTNGRSNGKVDNLLPEGRTRLFIISGFDEAASERQARILGSYLESRQGLDDDNYLDDLAYTLGERRTEFTWKAAVPASSKIELSKALSSGVKFSKANKKTALGFVFTGQGAQWCGMGKELITAYPVFRKTINKIGSYLASIGAPFDVEDELTKDPNDSQIGLALYSQPLCSAVQIALVDLLASWGIKPASVTGHSSGEIAAAYTMGALNMEDAMAVAYYRGLASSNMQKTGTVSGSMMAVGMSKEDALPYLSTLTKGKAGIACVNSPSSVTISGDTAAIDELQEILEEKKLFARKLAVEVAYHSHHMALVADEYEAALSGIKIRETGDIEFYSSVYGKRIDASELGPSYWVANMLGEVKFADSVRLLCLETSSSKKGRKRTSSLVISTIVELGPHSALAGPIKQILQADDKLKGAGISYVPSLVRKVDATKTTLDLAAKLLLGGYPVNLSSINRPIGTESRSVLVDLPPYPWNHSNSYWAEPRLSKVFRQRKYPRTDLLGALDRNSNPLEPRWRNHIRISEIPWVKDHKIQSNVVYPAAGYIVMAIEAAFQHATEKSLTIVGYKLREIAIGSALVIPEQSDGVEILVTFKPHTDSIRAPSDLWDEFCVYSVTEDNRWTEHCRGLIMVQTPQRSINVIDGDVQEVAEKKSHTEIITEMDDKCKLDVDIKEFYEKLTQLGLEYGETFANMIRARAARNRCIGTIAIPDTAAVMPMNFQFPFVLHPSTLDAIFHPIFVALTAEVGPLKDPAVPVYVEEIYISHDINSKPGDELVVYTNTKQKDNKYLTASMIVMDGSSRNSRPVVTISDLTCTTLARETAIESGEETKRIAYNYEWKADVSLLSIKDASNLCAYPTPPSQERHDVRALEQTAYYYMEWTLSKISPNELLSMEPHFQKQYASMERFIKSVREEKLSIPTELWVAADQAERANLRHAIRDSGPEGRLMCLMGRNLPAIMKGEIDPWSLLIREQGLEAYFRETARIVRTYDAVARYFDLLGHKNPHLSVLEIGAGTGGVTFPILETLGGADGELPRFQKYDCTDISSVLFDALKTRAAPWKDLIAFKELDVNHDPITQGYTAESYDVVVAAYTLHTSKSLHAALDNVRKLLKPGGKLVIIDVTRERMVPLVIFGTLRNWWSAEEENRQVNPVLSEEEWQKALLASDFSNLDVVVWDTPHEPEHQSSMMVATAPLKQTIDTPNVLVITEEIDCGVSVARLLEYLTNLRIDFEVTSYALANPTGKVCIVLSELAGSIFSDPSLEQFDTAKDIFTKSRGVVWVTRGGILSSTNPNSNLVTGFARTCRAETEATVIATLDLDSQPLLSPDSAAETIFNLFKHLFMSDHSSPNEIDTEYVEKSGQLLIPRLMENSKLSKNILSFSSRPVPELQPFRQPGRPLVMHVGQPGLLDTIHFIDDERMAQTLEDDQIEIEVKATGLNFKDVMMGLGQIQTETLGGECAGVVTAVGKDAKGFVVGDRVSTYGFGTLSNFYREKWTAFQKIPDDMSFEMGAALPVTYGTAYYSVYHLARVENCDSVLIHAATGGLGQALIELCQLIGAEIYATVGTQEKKELLMKQFKIAEDHIFYSRDGSFAKGIMRMTGGKGADVIFNSLAGEALRLTWDCIAPYGRFIELGARDLTINTRLEMKNFIKNPMFAAFNLVYLIRARREVGDKVWADVMDLFRSKSIKGPSPLHVHRISKVEEALRIMQSGKHMGKLVAVAEPDEVVQVTPKDISKNLLRPDASYLLVGGLGGIGRATALWMVNHGAKNLIFANRSGLASQEAQDTVSALRSKNVSVAVYSCDVSQSEALSELVAESSKSMPPIRGVIQGAMVLRDGLLEKMPLADYLAVIRPKVQGTWNLHNLLPKDMDFFLMLSSISGVIGNATQAAYAAGSTFMDAFAAYRNTLGLPAVTLDLGVITEVGYLAETDKELAAGMQRQGFEGTSAESLMTLIQSAIVNPRREGLLAQTVTGLGTWREGESLATFDLPIFSHFRRQTFKKDGATSTGARVRDTLKAVKTLDKAADLICVALIDKISSRSNIPVDDISRENPMSNYGIDSLVAVEMRNWIVREMDSTMPILELLANQSLQQLSAKIAQRSRLVDLKVAEKD
ncbi:putative polyketide synthase [Xylogone sp. PMI_703]|nr:putative polyketide synthase [Xylogone sp. PMI_703]